MDLSPVPMSERLAWVRTNLATPSMKWNVLFLALAVVSCGPIANPHENAQFGSDEPARAGQLALNTISQADTPPDPTQAEPLVWQWDSNARAALLQFDGGPTLFSVSCEKADDTVKFTRFAAAPHSGRGVLSFTTSTRAASLLAVSVATEPGPSGHWEAAAPAIELPAALEAMFRERMPIRIALADTPPLVAPPSQLAAKPLRFCRAD